MACAASATRSRNGNMTRVMWTASSNLPGTWWNPSASRSTRAGLKITPSTQNAPTIRISAVADQVREDRCFLAALLRQGLGEDGDEGGRQRAFGEQVAREIRNAEAQQERVVDEAGAEQPRHHDLAHQAGDARHGHGHRDDARGSNHAFGGEPVSGCWLPLQPISERAGEKSFSGRRASGPGFLLWTCQ